jgi:hypothetical protein
MLTQGWTRLSEVLLRHASDLEGTYDHCDAVGNGSSAATQTVMLGNLRQAVARVSALQLGSHRWWLAVHDVAELCSIDPVCDSEGAWSADP